MKSASIDESKGSTIQATAEEASASSLPTISATAAQQEPTIVQMTSTRVPASAGISADLPQVMQEPPSIVQADEGTEDEEQGLRKRIVAASDIGRNSGSRSPHYRQQQQQQQQHKQHDKQNDIWGEKDKHPVPIVYKATKTPTSTLNAIYEAGKYKAGLPLDLLCVQSFMAGVYIAMAGHLFLAVGGGVLGAALFPTGLIAVTLTSAELFTGDALVFVASVLGGKVPLSKLLRNWTVAWTMNFVGGLFWAYLLAYASDALDDSGQHDLAIKVAVKKAGQSFIHIFLKAIGANFMVCLGVWQATCAEQVAGKVLAMWFPITGFVLMGFEHCIANQFFIPLGMMLGAYDDDKISISDLFEALAAATLGNALGGGLLVGAIYWYVYDSMARKSIMFNTLRPRLMNQQQTQQRITLVQDTAMSVESSSGDSNRNGRERSTADVETTISGNSLPSSAEDNAAEIFPASPRSIYKGDIMVEES